ncbi:MAG: hypothetical protein PVJ86_01900 [Phycisphaerales bacterium]
MLANILLWAIPSNTAYLIAQHRDVLLGRYSVGHLTTSFLFVPVSILMLYLIWSNEQNKRQRHFKAMTLSVCVIVSIFVVDLLVRITEAKRYVRHEGFYHRQPNTVSHGTSHDVPEKAFEYSTMRPGYPDIEYTLTVDKRGFRNKADPEKCDVITLGDSFAEGSNVSDDQVWPVLLAEKSKLTVYNLGMSAGHPGTYLETLKRFGLELSPKVLVCMLYEGNDFRDSNFRRKSGLSYSISTYFKASPLRRAIRDSMIRCFGATGTSEPESDVSTKQNPGPDGESAPAPADNATKTLSWLPVAVPDGPNAKYYTFTVKRLLTHFITKQEFLRLRGCRKTFEALRQIKKICSQNSIRLVIVYAPDKPHTLLPLIEREVPPGELRAFMALKERNLPPAEKLMATLSTRLHVQETAVEEFCGAESIEFVSLTEPLRQSMAEGSQAYFTYDQHWTPIGHEIVAKTVRSHLQGDN